MNQGIIGIIIALLVILAGVVYWMNSSSGKQSLTSTSSVVNKVLPGAGTSTGNDGGGTSTTTSTSSSVGGATTTVGAVRTITITGRDYSFSPSTITVKRGDKVQLILTSAQGAHDIKIDALGVASKTVNTGESTSVEFTPTKAGTYEYYCSIGNHRAMGMKGTLTVE